MMNMRKYHWKYHHLGELCSDIEYGLTASAEDNGDTIFLRITDINDSGKLCGSIKYISVSQSTFDKYELKQNDILIARSGATAGKPYIHKSIGRFIFASYLLRIKLMQSYILPDYFFCFLNSSNYLNKLSTIKVGSAQPNINTVNLKTLVVPLPPLQEQKQLVNLFQTIDQAIDQVENQQSQLLQLRHGLCDGLIFGQPYFGDMLSNESCLPLLLEAFADSIEEHDKAKTDITRFVGLENIEPGEFIIKSWGNIEDGTTFTKRFRVGDVLFGKRRAYLKKVAVATFDGICSSDILVLRAKPEKILPGLLPFYISAEPFIEYAVTTSAGSLSPRTKWKDLAKFEISLPDLKTQEKILSVLQGIETTRLQLANQKANLKKLKQQLLNEILG